MILNFPSANDPNGIWELKAECDTAESYRTNPIFTGSGTFATAYSSETCDVIDFIAPSNPQGRFAWFITTDSDGRQLLLSNGTQSFGVYYDVNGSGRNSSGEIPCGKYNYSYQTSIDATYETNIPIFDTYEHKEAYVTARTDAEALEILEQYAVNYKKDICYISCVHVPEPPISWDFEYTNLSIHQASDSILTNINWNIATTAPNNMRYKSWILEFKVSEGATDSYNCLMSRPDSDMGEWFINSSGILKIYTGSSYQLSTNPVNDGSDIRIEFEPDLSDSNAKYGTISVYKNDILDRQEHRSVEYESRGSTMVPLRIGAYNSSGSDLFNGTFEYIRFRTLD